MHRPLRVLDLFSGLDGWGDPFREAGHEVFAIDIDGRFDADVHLDIGDVAAVFESVPWQPDVIFASPPCNAFSTGSTGKMWMHGSHPSPKRSDRYPDGHPIAIEGIALEQAASDEPWRQGPTVRLHDRLPLRQEGHPEGTPMS